MLVFKKIVFLLVKRAITLLDKYRTEYYAFKYPDQVEVGYRVVMSSGSSVIMVLGNKLSFLVIGEKTTFRRFCTLTLDGKANLNIGSNNFFNNNCSINCLGNIKIGDNNLFGESVKIYDHNHVFSNIEELIMNQGFKIGKIEIGNNCWIGSNTVILNNVIIGDNVVIGANNLIYKSIPSNTIVKADSKSIIQPIS